jgi:hypothetical protein
MKKFYSFVFICVFLSCIIAGCGSDGTGGVSPTATPIIQTPTATPVVQTVTSSGGTVAVGQGSVNFPANSVKNNVTVTGSTVNIIPYFPLGIGAASSVYEFKISDPNSYVANTAAITLPITGNTTGAKIYRSENGSSWTDIGGTVSGNNITTTVPGFSYFVVGSPVTVTTPTTIPTVGGNWTSQVKVNDSASTAVNPSIAVDPSGNAFALWKDSRNDPNGYIDDIYFSYRTAGGSWGGNEKLTSASGSDGFSSPCITVDTSGNAYATWEDSLSSSVTPVDPNSYLTPQPTPTVKPINIYFGYRPAGGSWSKSVITTDTNIGKANIAVDGAGNAYTVWNKTTYNNTETTCTIYFSSKPRGGSWSAGSVVTSRKTWISPKIAVDPSGNAWVIWTEYSNTGINSIYVSYRPAGGSWGAESLLTSSTFGTGFGNTEITADSSGTVYAVWNTTTSSVVPTPTSTTGTPVPTPTIFSYPTPVNTPTTQPLPTYTPAPALKLTGNVSFKDTSTGDIYFSYKVSGGSWSSPAVIASGSQGTYVSRPKIAVGSNGTVYVIWINYDEKSLNFSYLPKGGSWASPVRIDDRTMASIVQYGPAIGIDSIGKVYAIWDAKKDSNSKYGIYFSVRQ